MRWRSPFGAERSHSRKKEGNELRPSRCRFYPESLGIGAANVRSSKLEGFPQSWRSVVRRGAYTAASTSERIAFHTINRATGHRLHRQFVDSENGKPADRDDQVKGYEVEKGKFVVLEPEEIAAAVPESDKTLAISAFIGCGDVDETYFDRPYYLTPADKNAEEAFSLIREGMRKKGVAGPDGAVPAREDVADPRA